MSDLDARVWVKCKYDTLNHAEVSARLWAILRPLYGRKFGCVREIGSRAAAPSSKRIKAEAEPRAAGNRLQCRFVRTRVPRESISRR